MATTRSQAAKGGIPIDGSGTGLDLIKVCSTSPIASRLLTFLPASSRSREGKKGRQQEEVGVTSISHALPRCYEVLTIRRPCMLACLSSLL
jgi:hypothetical protein